MADVGYRLCDPMAVQATDGLVYAAADAPDGRVIFVFDAPAAAETGRRLQEAAHAEAAAPIPAGHVAKVSIAAPTNPAEPAALVLGLTDGRETTLTIGLHDLARLANTAAQALAVVAPSGRG